VVLGWPVGGVRVRDGPVVFVDVSTPSAVVVPSDVPDDGLDSGEPELEEEGTELLEYPPVVLSLDGGGFSVGVDPLGPVVSGLEGSEPVVLSLDG
jgi:hypothetical protein